MQGGHHVAQKLITTGLPAKSFNETRFPERSRRTKFLACRPLYDGLWSGAGAVGVWGAALHVRVPATSQIPIILKSVIIVPILSMNA